MPYKTLGMKEYGVLEEIFTSYQGSRIPFNVKKNLSNTLKVSMARINTYFTQRRLKQKKNPKVDLFRFSCLFNICFSISLSTNVVVEVY